MKLFETFEAARDVGAREIKGFPAWRVVENVAGFVIQYYPNGPFYPELQDQSPEVTGKWRCQQCGNKTEFKGIDFEAYGGPDVCHCGAAEHTFVESCVCLTTLVQPVTIRRDVDDVDDPRHMEVDHHRFEGGGSDAQIGEYDKIVCAACGWPVWLSAQYAATFGMQQ